MSGGGGSNIRAIIFRHDHHKKRVTRGEKLGGMHFRRSVGSRGTGKEGKKTGQT